MGIEVSAASVRKRARDGGVWGCSAIDERLLYRPVMIRPLLLALAFQLARPGYEFEFPRDHGAHDEYKTEWWYYTGHLRTDDGRRYGFELTFFRVGIIPPGEELQSRWDLHNLGLAHFAISDIDGKDF